jgi:hypothetical protein
VSVRPVTGTVRQSVSRLCWLGAAAALALAVAGCATAGATGVVSVKMARTPQTPRDASVYVDEEYVAPLYVILAHGGLLPVGEHRITVTKTGYFPYDVLVTANRKPIRVEVAMDPVPD